MYDVWYKGFMNKQEAIAKLIGDVEVMAGISALRGNDGLVMDSRRWIEEYRLKRRDTIAMVEGMVVGRLVEKLSSDEVMSQTSVRELGGLFKDVYGAGRLEDGKATAVVGGFRFTEAVPQELVIDVTPEGESV